jgi:hypothetical protein
MEMLLPMSCITLTSNAMHTTVELLINEGNYRSDHNRAVSRTQFSKYDQRRSTEHPISYFKLAARNSTEDCCTLGQDDV